MSNRKDDRLRKLLKRAELNKPGSLFTEGVMAEIQQEMVFNPALKSVLKNAPVGNPQGNFTQGVMSKLETTDFETTETSIISKKTWYMVSGLVIGIVALAFFWKPRVDHTVFSYFAKYGKSLQEISRHLGEINSVFILCLSSVSCLLLLDYFMRERKVKSEKLKVNS